MLTRLIIATGLLLAATSAASADPFSIGVALFSIFGSTLVAGTVTAFVVTGVIAAAEMIGLSYLAKALAPKPTTPDITTQPGGTSGKLQSGGAVPRSFVVGRGMTAGSLVYGNTYSPVVVPMTIEDAVAAGFTGWGAVVATGFFNTQQAAGNTPNAYLVQVIALSDIPVAGLAGLLVSGVPVTWNPAATQSFEGIPIPEYSAAGKDYLWIRFYDGTQVAADTTLVGLFGADPDRPYSSARIGTGVAYAVVTALVNQDLFSGFPQLKFILDGVKLYDRRYDSTAGGSGSQLWSTPSTWALTGNPVVIAENILRGISYGGQWVYGAQTVTATQLPSSSWMAAASECDTAIALNGGGTELQFYASGEITFTTEPASTIEELLKACNGRLAEIGGTYKIRAGAAGSAVFSFTDGDILSTEQQTFDPFPSLGQTINAVTAKYISPAEGWNPKDAAPLYDATLEALDGGRRQSVDVNYSFVTSGTAVQRLMKSERDGQRAFRHHAIPMPPDAFVLEPLDVISWTSTRNGYVAKLFEVVTADDLPNFNMGLALKELDPNAYDWVPATDETPVVDGTIAMLRPAPQPIVDWNAVPWIIHSDSAQDMPGIKLSWDPNTDDIDGIQFEVRIKSSAEVIHRGDTDRWAAGSIIISQSLIFNTVYQARGQYRSASARETIWSDWLDVTTPDVRETLASFEAALRDYVTNEFNKIKNTLKGLNQILGTATADQDAHNFLDKYRQKVNLAATDAQVMITQQQQVTDQLAFDAYQITVAAQFTDTEGHIANAKSEAIFAAESYATGALATYDLNVQTTYSTKAATATALAEILAAAEVHADNAVATLTETVSVSIGNLNASVSTQSAAIANLNGQVAAAWSVKVNAGGAVAGIQLVNGGSGPYGGSAFIVSADVFEVAWPGVGGGDPVPVFAIQNVNGTAKLAFRGDMYADGTITAQKLAVGELSAIVAQVGLLHVGGNIDLDGHNGYILVRD